MFQTPDDAQFYPAEPLHRTMQESPPSQTSILHYTPNWKNPNPPKPEKGTRMIGTAPLSPLPPTLRNQWVSSHVLLMIRLEMYRPLFDVYVRKGEGCRHASYPSGRGRGSVYEKSSEAPILETSSLASREISKAIGGNVCDHMRHSWSVDFTPMLAMS